MKTLPTITAEIVISFRDKCPMGLYYNGKEITDEVIFYFESALLKVATETVEAVMPEARQPTLCGNCNLNGPLCKECYANRRANAVVAEMDSNFKTFINQ